METNQLGDDAAQGTKSAAYTTCGIPVCSKGTIRSASHIRAINERGEFPGPEMNDEGQPVCPEIRNSLLLGDTCFHIPFGDASTGQSTDSEAGTYCSVKRFLLSSASVSLEKFPFEDLNMNHHPQSSTSDTDKALAATIAAIDRGKQ